MPAPSTWSVRECAVMPLCMRMCVCVCAEGFSDDDMSEVDEVDET